VVETGGLENRCTGNRTGGSNPSPSASYFCVLNERRRRVWFATFGRFCGKMLDCSRIVVVRSPVVPDFRRSVGPPSMAQRTPIQLFPEHPPLRRQSIHVLPEPLIVMSLQKVDHLVHQDVFQARRGLLR
jgi:hypothetical protein